MSRQVLATSSGGDFQLVPQGPTAARCIDVIDLGDMEVTWNGELKIKHKVELVFVTAHMGDNGLPLLIWQRYTMSLHVNATLGQHLVSWRGRPFTEDEKKGFNIENVLNVPCMLNVTHTSKGDATYDNVAGIMALPKGMEAPEAPHDFVRDYLKNPSRDVLSQFYQPKKGQITPAPQHQHQHQPQQQAPPPQQAYQQPPQQQQQQQQPANVYAQGQPQPALAANNGQHTQALYGNGQPVNNGQPAQAQQAGTYGFDPDADLPF